MALQQYRGTGRRKTSTAQVRLVAGSGDFVVNDQTLDEYFDLETLRVMAREPIDILEVAGDYDVLVKVDGGGTNGQAGAIRHGLARALEKVDSEFRAPLKSAGMLTRDARMKERHKYGLRKARRAPQFSKR